MSVKKLYTSCAQVLNIEARKVHIPVLKEDVQKYLSLKGGEVVVDMTLGLGGHALDILKAIGENGMLIAFEQDEKSLSKAKDRLKAYEQQIIYIHDNFRYFKNRITGEEVAAILFDLGISSLHVDQADRGFSFLKDGPLDMRFDQRNKLTAADVVNTYKEEDLARIFIEYGEERMAKKVARELCKRRTDKNFSSTVEFSEFLERILPKKRSKRGSKLHPATKIFQAIRIEVNDELNALKEALEQSVETLKIGGRIVVISYHSLEDRIVKQFFKRLERPPVKSAEEGLYRTHGEPIVKNLTKKPVIPTEEEVKTNPRSRSAKLRAYEKLSET